MREDEDRGVPEEEEPQGHEDRDRRAEEVVEERREHGEQEAGRTGQERVDPEPTGGRGIRARGGGALFASRGRDGHRAPPSRFVSPTTIAPAWKPRNDLRGNGSRAD